MKAFLLAAGLGTRLQPITNSIPKVLVKINHKTLLEYAIEKLMENGVSEIIINVHHFSEMVKDFIKTLSYPKLRIEISDETDFLLDTGGGLKKAAWFFDDGQPFIVYNADIFTDLDLKMMLAYHIRHHALVTLAVSDRKTSRYLLFDKDMKLCGWKNEKTGELLQAHSQEQIGVKLAFSGIHIIQPEFLKLLDKQGAFPIIPEYVRLSNHHSIFGFNHTNIRWLDLGKPESLKMGEQFYQN